MSKTQSGDRNGVHENSTASGPEPRHAIPVETRRVLLSEIDLEDRKYQLRVETRAGDLKRSLQDNGQFDPVVLVGAQPPYRLIDGFRRCTAARSLGWSTVMAMVHEQMDDLHALKMAFTRNAERKNLLPVDRVNAVRIAIERRMTRVDIAVEFAMSEKQIGRYLALLRMPAEVLAAIDGVGFTMAHALVLKKFNVGNVQQVVADVIARNISAQQLLRSLVSLLGTGASSGGERKVLVARVGNSIRFLAGSVSLDSPQAELERVEAQLIDALATLQWHARSTGKRKGLRPDDAARENDEAGEGGNE